MRKTLNGKSSRCDVSKERNCHRLKAVSDYSFCEVRPGVGSVKKMKNVIAGPGITHVTCTEGRIQVKIVFFKKSGTADILRLLRKAGGGVFFNKESTRPAHGRFSAVYQRRNL